MFLLLSRKQNFLISTGKIRLYNNFVFFLFLLVLTVNCCFLGICQGIFFQVS